MAKIVFALSSFYLVVYGVRSFIAMFANDWNGVDGYSNTVLFSGLVMIISFIATLQK